MSGHVIRYLLHELCEYDKNEAHGSECSSIYIIETLLVDTVRKYTEMLLLSAYVQTS